jgi:hypothetical protein
MHHHHSAVTHKAPLIVAGIVFSLMAIMHIWRLYSGTIILVGSTLIPTWVTILGLIISLALAAWMFGTAAMCCCRHHDIPRHRE